MNHALLFDTINFILLVGGLGYILRKGILIGKPIGQIFKDRSEEIRRGLEEGRKALEAARAQLHAAEEKLAKLESEIAALRDLAVSEIQTERDRLKKAAEEEAAKIAAFVRTEMESETRIAQMALKNFAAEQALSRAGDSLRARMSEAGHRRLFVRFLMDLESQQSSN